MGRRALDPAELARRRIWAAHIRALRNGASWDKLDDEFVWSRENNSRDDQERPRRFSRIFKAGHDPECAMAHGHPTNLVELCAKSDTRLAAAKASFHSPFWKLILPPGPDFSEISALHAIQLDRLGIYQAPDRIGDSAAQINVSEPTWEQNFKAVSPLWSGAEYLCRLGTFDALFVLCFQLRLAIDKLRFDAAELYVGTTRRCLRRISYRLALPEQIFAALAILTEKRAIRNDWSTVYELVAGRGDTTHRTDGAAATRLVGHLQAGHGHFSLEHRPAMHPIIRLHGDDRRTGDIDTFPPDPIWASSTPEP